MKTILRLLLLLLLFCFGNRLTAQITFTTGLKCYFPMNGDFYNATGDCQKHPDLASATFTNDVDGMANDAGFFNGSTRLRFLNKLVNTDMASFSIDFWFQSTSVTNEPLYWEAVANGQGVWIRMEPGSNRIRVSLGNTSTNNNVYTTSAFNDGNWHQFVLTAQTGNTAKVYIDGVLNASNVQAYNTGTTSSITKIGTDDGLTIYLNGGLDNLHVWNRPLTSTEVSDLYNAPRINLGTPASSTLCAGSTTTLPFTVSGGNAAFQPGNVFYAQLSDPQGSFVYPLNIGSASGTGSGAITIAIPDSVASGSNYKVRILASDYPVASQNEQVITINNANAPTGFDLFSDLAIHYPFDGNATDISGNGINGTIISGITSAVGHNGISNTALSFNGSNSELNIGKTWPVNSLNGTTKPFSISFWMRQSSTPSTNNFGYIFSCWDPNAMDGLFLGTTDAGKVRFRINGAGGQFSGFVEAPISNNQWVNVVAVYNGTNIKLYVNGVQSGGTYTTSGTIAITVNPHMGWQMSNNTEYFTGRLDEFRFYNRALTLQEAQTLHNDGSLASSNSPLCNGGTLLLNGPTYVGLQYNWSGPSGFSDNVEDPFIANFNPFTNVGLYYLTTTLNGCTGTPQSTLVQSSVPTVPTVTSSTFCAGSSVTLTASGATAGQQYIWYNDAAGTNQIAGNVSNYTFAPAATDTVYVGLYDGVSCYSALTPVIATMNPLPNVSATVSPASGIVCQGNPVTLSGSGAQTYSWTGSVINNVAFNPASSSSYTVTGTDANGCNNTATVSVTVNALPTVTVSLTPSNGTVCNGNPVTLDGTGSATTYNWSGGVTNNVSFTPLSSGTYTLTATDANGCLTTATANVTVNALPNVTAVSVPANGMVCAGGTATLSGGGASLYTWSGGVSDNVPFVPVTTSTYTVTGTDANGCINTATTGITLNPLPVIGASSSPANGIVCAGSTVVLNGNGASAYSWSGGVTDGVGFAATSSNTYTVTGTDANGCQDTATITITANPLPVVTFDLSPSTYCINWSAVNLNASPAGGIFSGPGITGNSFDPAAAGAGSYMLTYTYTDVNGCSNSDTALATVDLCLSVNGIAQENTFGVSPNPSAGEFLLNAYPDLQLEIYDVSGQLLLSEKTTEDHTRINLSEYATGVYYLRLLNEQGVLFSRTLLKQ